ncbi:MULTISPECIES: HpcH/HpaI aldolase/citrate lyase family protein [Mycobacterium]|jgi:citrate lyase subunit beta/citryl-CoA lyase|uniref:HpcH/HpaI aldolase/citrate lyase family protein n=1 Tax=Mycobacterium TaxID=1763 RepID=UPI000F024C43|nr:MULTISPECIES: CoA ester lyase [Mycobacterium]TDK98160.1 CoA ester lyase [Mycobacterium paragordonae]VAZ69694.1 L-malyl-CoA/beta-methylmalyl-CoA lyase [Mycobacterium kansasii]
MTTSRPQRLRRSELSTPASNTRMIEKAIASDADLAFLDLEDAVAPDEKVAARANVIAAFNDHDWGKTIRAYRINGVHTQWCHDDLIDVVTAAGPNVDIIIVPKVYGPRDIWFVDDLLNQLEIKLGLEPGSIGLEVLIEEAEALGCVEAIAAASPRLEALILGLGDLAGSQGIRPALATQTADGDQSVHYPGDIWHHARTRLIMAARANGLDPIDGPFANVVDTATYRRDATWVATIGAVGKWCIHPSQIAVANTVFAPTAQEIEQASAVMGALHEAEAAGHGAATFNGMMIDAAVSRIYEPVLERARMCGLM